MSEMADDGTQGTSGPAAIGGGRVATEGLDVSHGPILYLDDITVSFDGFKALNNLTLTVEAGELRCIIGPNGAGKTTMMDVITGKTRPDSGTAFFGQTIDLLRMTEPQIAATLEQIKLADAPDRPAGLLSHGQKQWLGIGMLLMQEPRLLLLDEPVAGMTDAETERTAELFNSLAGKHTLVVVEHDMDFVGAIARTVTVLHEGSVLAEGAMDVVQNDERVIEVYLGR